MMKYIAIVECKRTWNETKELVAGVVIADSDYEAIERALINAGGRPGNRVVSLSHDLSEKRGSYARVRETEFHGLRAVSFVPPTEGRYEVVGTEWVSQVPST